MKHASVEYCVTETTGTGPVKPPEGGGWVRVAVFSFYEPPPMNPAGVTRARGILRHAHHWIKDERL